MRTLSKPLLAPSSVLSTCIAGISDPALQARVESVQPTLLAAAVTYEKNAQACSLHLVPRVQCVGSVTKDELKDLYNSQMSATGGAARSIYNALRNAAPNSKCPLCGIGTVAVLDHHLPKSKYPDLSVCPTNLVPACDFCNNAKHARFPRSSGQQTLHPYYDDFTKEQWIYARLDRAGPPVLLYEVRPPSHWPTINSERVKRHYSVVKLGQSYASNANDELITLKNHLETIWEKKKEAGVSAYLIDEAARHVMRINSWQHAMYQALALDQWFVSGGYKQIAQQSIAV